MHFRWITKKEKEGRKAEEEGVGDRRRESMNNRYLKDKKGIL